MKKLFWDDPYQTECEARVLKIEGNTVELDQSIFYAFSGGQASDVGSINGIEVVRAEKEGDKENIINIHYELSETPSFAVGDTVSVKIDGERRKNLRNLHSVTHIVYYILREVLGKNMKIVGSNISPEKGRIDVTYDEPLTEKLISIQEQTNAFLAEDHAITMKDDPEKEDLKWWYCGEWKMPCGGTHVRSTKEIGSIALKRKNVGSGKERVEITLNS